MKVEKEILMGGKRIVKAGQEVNRACGTCNRNGTGKKEETA